jgi:hypothetical protein
LTDLGNSPTGNEQGIAFLIDSGYFRIDGGFFSISHQLEDLIRQNNSSTEKTNLNSKAISMKVLNTYKNHYKKRHDQIISKDLKKNHAPIFRKLSKELLRAADAIDSFDSNIFKTHEKSDSNFWSKNPAFIRPPEQESNNMSAILDPISKSNLRAKAKELDQLAETIERWSEDMAPGYNKPSGRPTQDALGNLWDSLRNIAKDVNGYAYAHLALNFLGILTDGYSSLPELQHLIKNIEENIKEENPDSEIDFKLEDHWEAMTKALDGISSSYRKKS